MMTVYVLTRTVVYDPTEIIGVFSTLEAAFRAAQEKTLDGQILEFDLMLYRDDWWKAAEIDKGEAWCFYDIKEYEVK